MGALGKGELDRIFLVGLSTPVVALVKLETVTELLGNGSSTAGYNEYLRDVRLLQRRRTPEKGQ